jgi:hypothetical protein
MYWLLVALKNMFMFFSLHFKKHHTIIIIRLVISGEWEIEWHFSRMFGRFSRVVFIVSWLGLIYELAFFTSLEWAWDKPLSTFVLLLGYDMELPHSSCWRIMAGSVMALSTLINRTCCKYIA